MSRRKLIIAAVILAVAGVGWYLFRPELLFINSRVNESFPTASASEKPAALSSGEFHNGAHETKGTATLYQLPDGKKTLSLTNFETSNGPDVVVYLVAASDANDSETVKQAGFLELGSSKGNIGAQNDDVPLNIDHRKYKAVTI